MTIKHEAPPCPHCGASTRQPRTVSTRELQQDITAHKQRMGFNTTDSGKEIRLLRGEVDELAEALTGTDTAHIGQELADVTIYLLTLADMHGLDLGEEVVKKMAVNKGRRYERGPGGTHIRVS
jgi:NTP pyrophosphatase (non-canonical NTP hydrolase)